MTGLEVIEVTRRINALREEVGQWPPNRRSAVAITKLDEARLWLDDLFDDPNVTFDDE